MSRAEGRELLVREVAVPSAEGLLRRLSRESYPALLDSAGGPAHLRRWSVAAFDPFHLLTHYRGATRRVSLRQGLRCEQEILPRRNPLHVLRQVLGEYAKEPQVSAEVAALELPAYGAAVGFMGYEMGRHIERLPGRAARDVDLPEMHWGFYDHLLLIDHAAGRAHVVAGDVGGRSPQMLTERWLRLLEESGDAGDGGRIIASPAGPARPAGPAMPATLGELDRTFSRDGYMRAVERAIEYIAAGDIFQIGRAHV